MSTRRSLSRWFPAMVLAISSLWLGTMPLGAGESNRKMAPDSSRPHSEIVSPRLGKHVPPVYPPSLRAERLKAKVLLQVPISATGGIGTSSVLRCEVTRKKKADPALSQYCPEFEKAAEECISQWTFEPATQDGKPVAILYTIRIEFDPRMIPDDAHQ